MTRVLVVDDHPAVAQAVAELVRLSGCEADVVHDGEAALAFLRTGRVELVLLDVSMPGVSGLDVLRTMGAEGLLGATSVVMFSAEEGYRNKAMMLGAAGFVLKHEADDLVAEIERHTRCRPSPGDDPHGRHVGPAV